VGQVTIEEGKDDKIGDRKFDLVLANINKNVLVSALPQYVNALNKNGELLMSGFFTTDVAALKEAAEKTGLKFVSTQNEGEWALVHFVK
jgi:ribosomal protein L11 methyltransferase